MATTLLHHFELTGREFIDWLQQFPALCDLIGYLVSQCETIWRVLAGSF